MGEVLGEDWAAGSHEVEDVAEHSSISDRGRRVYFLHILKNFKRKVSFSCTTLSRIFVNLSMK